MKKVFIIASMAVILFSACSNNPNKESETPAQNETETMSADTSAMVSPDSTVVDTEKAAKDSADAAHGHTH